MLVEYGNGFVSSESVKMDEWKLIYLLWNGCNFVPRRYFLLVQCIHCFLIHSLLFSIISLYSFELCWRSLECVACSICEIKWISHLWQNIHWIENRKPIVFFTLHSHHTNRSEYLCVCRLPTTDYLARCLFCTFYSHRYVIFLFLYAASAFGRTKHTYKQVQCRSIWKRGSSQTHWRKKYIIIHSPLALGVKMHAAWCSLPGKWKKIEEEFICDVKGK